MTSKTMSIVFGTFLVIAMLVPAAAETMEERLKRLEEELAELKEQMAEQQDQVKSLDGTLTEAVMPHVDKWEKIKLGGYVQFRYEDKDHPTDATKRSETTYIRRGRLTAEGKSDLGKYSLQLDASKSSVNLKDAYGEFTIPNTQAKVRFGQMKWLFGHWVPLSSSVRLMPERPLVLQELFAGERDRGLWMSHPLHNTEDENAIPVTLYAGIYNGNGVDEQDKSVDSLRAAGFVTPAGWGRPRIQTKRGSGLDNNDKQDYRLRLTAQPTPELDLGVSAYFGENTIEAWDDANNNKAKDAGEASQTYTVDRNRLGADLHYVNASGFGLKAEYVKGEDGPQDTDGFAVQVSQRLTPTDIGAVMYDTMGRTGEQRSVYWKAAWLHYIDGGTRLRLAHEIGKEHVDGQDITTIELMKSF